MEHAAAAVPFYQDGEFWVLVAFLIFMALALRPILRAIGSALDQRAAKIKAEIEEAERLQEEAKAALASYQRKQREALKDAEDIVATAKASAERLRERLQGEMENSLKRREQLALDRIKQAEENAMAAVRAQATDLALVATQRLIAATMTADKGSALIDQAIGDLQGRLH